MVEGPVVTFIYEKTYQKKQGLKGNSSKGNQSKHDTKLAWRWVERRDREGALARWLGPACERGDWSVERRDGLSGSVEPPVETWRRASNEAGRRWRDSRWRPGGGDGSGFGFADGSRTCARKTPRVVPRSTCDRIRSKMNLSLS
ncbi:hypothetical protein GWI33_019705 [Rhynchophorus ferrugineus]|uniref:Uncharacterized protein n=1 Tax=Rhynchophorus ferrugineus TaxID=354439 RepID=A0A834HQY7_RHYFE|nr:hypothetical protein GWI33_019705 [Rhynchophorus ferrugineus]